MRDPEALPAPEAKAAGQQGTSGSPLRFFDGSFFVLLGLTVTSGAVAFWLRGLEDIAEATAQLLSDLAIIGPQIVMGVLIGSLLTLLLPHRVVARVLGAQAGLKGIAIAGILGTVMPGGPFTAVPIVLALGRAGAGIGALTAFLIGWAVVGLQRVIIWELPFMGFEFAMLRFVSSLPLPIIAGLLAEWLSARFAFFKLKWD